MVVSLILYAGVCRQVVTQVGGLNDPALKVTKESETCAIGMVRKEE